MGRLVTILFGDTSASHTAADLGIATGLSERVVAHALHELTGAGAVLRSDERPARYRANPDYYWHGELASMAAKRGGSDDVVSALRSAFAGLAWIRAAYLTGAYVAGTAGPRDDIAGLAVLDDVTAYVFEWSTILYELSDIEESAGRNLSFRIVSVDDFAAAASDPGLAALLAGPIITIKD
jgi:hypothetical protein